MTKFNLRTPEIGDPIVQMYYGMTNGHHYISEGMTGLFHDASPEANVLTPGDEPGKLCTNGAVWVVQTPENIENATKQIRIHIREEALKNNRKLKSMQSKQKRIIQEINDIVGV